LGSYQVSASVKNTINLPSYFSTIASVTLASGLVFELPVVAYFLSKVGLITPQFLKTYRKHSYVVILILAAIITPPDVFSQILVTIPLVILYEVSIFISAAIYRKKEKESVA
jgi:sec-independent protein translocase protein TatC